MKKVSMDIKTYQLFDPATKNCLKKVLSIGWDSHAPVTPPSEDDIVDATNINEPSQNKTSDSMAGNIEEDVLLLTSGETTDLESDLKNQISTNQLSDEALRMYFEKKGIKPVREWKKNMEKFRNWLDIEPRRRP
jgi:hypothetical protein